jgi:hypothetical protein
MTSLRTLMVALVVCSISVMTFGGDQRSVQSASGYVPASGFVPDEATAVHVAEAILIPIYGQSKVESERPFTAKLTGNVWTVTGHLPAGVDGGVAEVRIDKRDSRVLRVTHGK